MEVMEIAKVTSSGQLTLSADVVFAIEKIQNDFDGEAERLGLNDIDDVVRLVKEVRAIRNEGRKYASNA